MGKRQLLGAGIPLDESPENPGAPPVDQAEPADFSPETPVMIRAPRL